MTTLDDLIRLSKNWRHTDIPLIAMIDGKEYPLRFAASGMSAVYFEVDEPTPVK